MEEVDLGRTTRKTPVSGDHACLAVQALGRHADVQVSVLRPIRRSGSPRSKIPAEACSDRRTIPRAADSDSARLPSSLSRTTRSDRQARDLVSGRRGVAPLGNPLVSVHEDHMLFSS